MPFHAIVALIARPVIALLADLPDELFPGGAKAGWWLKAVQLDLEAKGLIRRGSTKPVRLFKPPGAD